MHPRQLALQLLRVSGAYRLGRRVNKNRLVVLTYHKVLADNLRTRFARRPETILFASEFESQITHLANRYSVLTGDEFRAILADHRPFPAHSALITFDDGYENNYIEAFPILRRAGATALFFLTTNFVGHTGSYLWFDRLDAISTTLTRGAFTSWAHARKMPEEASTPDSFRTWLKALTGGERERLLLDLEHLAGPVVRQRLDPEIAGPMTWDQAREMAGHGMTFGSHTASHQILANISPEEATVEVVTSRRDIEAHLDRPCWSFSYPNGETTDFRPADQAAVKAAGYECAFSQVPGFVDRRGDPFALHRMPIPASSDLNAFLSRVSGVHSLLSRG
jgi:peptidoglycan/xylan/chitin deacetylase (PgdA/CDA1 family)